MILPDDESYRTCSECGGDCEPEATGNGSTGLRIAFVCGRCGVHSIVDPFGDTRA